MKKFGVIALVALTLALNFGGSARAAAIDVDKATILEINQAFDAGTLTSEQLVQMYLARIAAYDRQGPKLHAVITLNQKALETARALDAERKAKGKRSLMHGIPIVLKDNMDTSDMPTTAGSVLLEGWVPPKDAFVVKKLRDAGAIILAKVNLSEFATAAPTVRSVASRSIRTTSRARRRDRPAARVWPSPPPMRNSASAPIREGPSAGLRRRTALSA